MIGSEGSRRSFLALAAHSAVLAPMGFTAAAAQESGRQGSAKPLRLGLVTYNWGRNWDIPTIINNCRATGFAGVELRSTHKHGVEVTIDDAARRKVKSQFQDSGVTLVGLGSACEYHAKDQAVVRRNIEETKQWVRLCHDVGASGVKVRPNGLPKGVPVEQTLEQIGQSLREVGRFADDFNVQIRVEVHGRGTSEIPHMQTIMHIADHPRVVVCWNCNPADLKGEGLTRNYSLLSPRMGTIHIHDLRSNKYPWQELFPLLRKTRAKSFTGWTLLEEGKVSEDIVTAMKENHGIWKSLVEKSRVAVGK